MFHRLGMRRAAVAQPPALETEAAAQSGVLAVGKRFQVRERLFAFGNDFWVETADGRRAFWVDGKALRLRDTLLFKTLDGQERYRLQEKVVRVRDTMNLYGPDGRVIAEIHKALVTPVRQRYTMNVNDQGSLETRGNILQHEFTIERDGAPVATISKRWFRIRDTYGVEVAPGSIDPLLAIAMTVAIDMLQEAG